MERRSLGKGFIDKTSYSNSSRLDACSLVSLPLLFFISCNIGVVLESQRDFIPALQQHFLPVWIDIKFITRTILASDSLVFQIDFQLEFLALPFINQIVHFLIFQTDRKDAVFHAVIIEDVCIAGSDDYAESVIQNRPGSMFTRRTAAEIFLCDQNFGVVESWVIQHKLFYGCTIGMEAPMIKEIFAESCSFNTLKKLF